MAKKKDENSLIINNLETRINKLENTLKSKEKIINVLMKRVERSIDNAGSPYSLFERQVLLEKLVEQRTRDLKNALLNIKTLRGLLPICSYCKNIRNDEGYWQRVDEYLRDNTEVELSHSLCPGCVKIHYPSYSDDIE